MTHQNSKNPPPSMYCSTFDSILKKKRLILKLRAKRATLIFKLDMFEFSRPKLHLQFAFGIIFGEKNRDILVNFSTLNEFEK